MRRARAVCPAWVPMEVSVLFVDRKRMREINRIYHSQDRMTDVLSFTYPADMTGKRSEGELYLCPEQIGAQAPRYGSTRVSEYARVIVHGILHLQGYDHMTSSDRRRMNLLSSKILSNTRSH
ncbi:rRNA maturation RNase YbeY [Candidatus Uhrbacteria bacterium]|nr:rRNA maturation RNase YbeY [Candidatus Uhrbacteria bacterium]